jgi:sec-independent protein translocase protein TatB
MTGAIQAASIGIPDTLFIMILALVVFGPRRLPEIGRQIGKLMYEFRKASNEFKFQMEEEMRKSEEDERRKKLEAENSALYPTLNAPGTTIDSSDSSTTETTTAADESATKLPETSESTTLTIQPPSTGETIIRGKTLSQLNDKAVAAADQTHAVEAARTVEQPVKPKPPTKPRAPKKSVALSPPAESEATTEAEPAKSTKARKKAVSNG